MTRVNGGLFFHPFLVCTFIAPKLCSLSNGDPLVQTVNTTMVAVAYNHRSCWRLFIKQNTLLIVLTPGNRLIYTHFVHVYDVVDLDNKQVKVDSLHKHPTESCHQKILQKGRHCDTTTLRRKKNKWLKLFKGQRENSRQF